MAVKGILGQVDMGAGAATNIYVVPASTTALFSITITNRNSTSVLVRLSLSATSATMANAEYLLKDHPLSPAGAEKHVFNSTGWVLQAGKYVIGYSDTANVTFQVNGVEEAV